jgi:hypothetical protein
MNSKPPICIGLAMLFIVLTTAFAEAQKLGAATGKSGKKTGSTNQTTYNPNDVIAEKINGSLLFTAPDKTVLMKMFDMFLTDQSNGEELVKNLPSVGGNSLPSDAVKPNNVLIVHVVVWESSSGAYQPSNGAWAFYRVGKGDKFRLDFDLSGTPYLYKPPHIYFIDMNYFDKSFKGGNATFTYTITTTPRQKQNAADLATLASSLLKMSSTAGGPKIAAAGVESAQVWGTVVELAASSPLPYDLAISATLKGTTGNEQYISCDPSPCSFSKTVPTYDPEYWDVSLGVTIPGVLEGVYPKNATTPFTASASRHVDAYAFIDVYPFQPLAHAPNTLTYSPHFNVGIPITSQSLHRPYVGMAENLSFLTKLIRLNIPLAVYAGPVFMKQQVYDARTSSLKWDHAIKGLYGLELPISAITNYMKSGSKSSSSNKSSTSSNGGGS